MNSLEKGQDLSTLENTPEEITLAPSNFQLFLVCLAVLALLGACFAAGYNAGKRNPRLKTASQEFIPGKSPASGKITFG